MSHANPGTISRLTAADIDDALRLSAAADWNQNAADWRTMLELGLGWGIRLPADGGAQQPLAASTVVLPYDGGFAWVSMVLVLPEFRRLGLATRLLQHALAELERRGLVPVLDATPAGHAVYVQQGFADRWGFARYRRPAGAALAPGPAGVGAVVVRALDERDWPALAALDASAFGADRSPLLRALAQRLPRVAQVAVDRDGSIRGFVLGRDGREASQIGPLIADDEQTARALLAAVLPALPGAVYVDLCDRQHELRGWLQAQGFAFQRPFTRMVHVAPGSGWQLPSNPATIVLVAGPELG